MTAHDRIGFSGNQTESPIFRLEILPYPGVVQASRTECAAQIDLIGYDRLKNKHK
jgi:hypothetical protein